MTTKACRKSGRKHTPIVSQSQRRLFEAVASGSVRLPGLSIEEAKRHLREVRGKKLPKRTAQRGRSR